MSNQLDKKAVLEQAIQKAIDGGWKPDIIGDFKEVSTNVVTGEWFALWQYKDINPYGLSAVGIIFNHDFAKALWGEEPITRVVGQAYPDEEDEDVYAIPWNIEEKFLPWQFHLSNMVLADDPIKYLGENI